MLERKAKLYAVGRCRLVKCNELVDGVREKLDNVDDGGIGKAGLLVSPMKSCRLTELKSFGPCIMGC